MATSSLYRFFAALCLLAFWSFSWAQNVSLLSDDHEGIVVRFDFSDPQLQEVETPQGPAFIPRVLGDTPLLRAGAPDLSKVDATVLIAPEGGTALEILESAFIDIPEVDIAPSKATSTAMWIPRMCRLNMAQHMARTPSSRPQQLHCVRLSWSAV